jgi:hypothetical protein
VPCLVLTKVEVSLQVPYRFVLGAEGRGRLIGECRTQGPDDVRVQHGQSGGGLRKV